MLMAHMRIYVHTKASRPKFFLPVKDIFAYIVQGKDAARTFFLTETYIGIYDIRQMTGASSYSIAKMPSQIFFFSSFSLLKI